MSQLFKVLLSIASIISINNAYYISLHALEWENASIWCQSYCSSHLASIHSTNDHLATLDLIDRNHYIYSRVWIGLNDIEISDIWQWSDGTLFQFGNVQDPITGFLAPGTYPWRIDEPDHNDSDQCVAYEVGSNYPTNSKQWVDRKKWANYHFACNSCSGQLHKYAAVNMRPGTAYNYSYAQEQCQDLFGTSLASIHSDRDMLEAQISCKQLTSINGCWLGLKKVGTIYEWDDGTEWDYGRTLHEWPWYVSEPGTTSDQFCIFLDPENGKDPGEYLWDDFWCNDPQPKTLCNAPSEICNAGQWFIAKGKETDYIFTKTPCELTKTVMDKESVAILGDKQFFNSLGTLSVEIMYSITDIIQDGNVGVVFYFDESNCNNYYYIGIWPGYSILLFGKYVNNKWTLITHKDIGFVYKMGSFYSLKIDLTAGTTWSISLNTDYMIQLITDHIDDTFNNSNNKLSGYIGIRNVNASFIVKSLFISGEVQYFDDNSWYFGCTQSPTISPTNIPSSFPTVEPTYNPSLEPTLEPTYNPTKETSAPSRYPSIDPTSYPTSNPTRVQTEIPTVYPTIEPIYIPTNNPTNNPTYNSLYIPTINPRNNIPTNNPTSKPSQYPSEIVILGSTVNSTTNKSSDIDIIADNPASTQKGQIQIIWIVAIPIAIMLMCGFGVYLITNYYKKTKKEPKKIEKTKFIAVGTGRFHVQSPSNSVADDDDDNDMDDIQLEMDENHKILDDDDDDDEIEMAPINTDDVVPKENDNDNDDDDADDIEMAPINTDDVVPKESDNDNDDDEKDNDLEEVTMLPISSRNDDGIHTA